MRSLRRALAIEREVNAFGTRASSTGDRRRCVLTCAPADYRAARTFAVEFFPNVDLRLSGAELEMELRAGTIPRSRDELIATLQRDLLANTDAVIVLVGKRTKKVGAIDALVAAALQPRANEFPVGLLAVSLSSRIRSSNLPTRVARNVRARRDPKDAEGYGKWMKYPLSWLMLEDFIERAIESAAQARSGTGQSPNNSDPLLGEECPGEIVRSPP